MLKFEYMNLIIKKSLIIDWNPIKYMNLMIVD